MELTPSHAKMHNMTKLEFLDKYPECRTDTFYYGSQFDALIPKTVFHKSHRKWYK